ncbi:maleylpyruvate isomerase family mycothiol-dependent enzyme [Streptomyces sp. TRM66268-LWL]|uniref:Maleylpyruvate isomerase family mycothiol-dependent enzyme n=1 Tax=Streptomyces polyasparticus TaxID=2767826 RepID=A0ABR7SUE4_9ACTN|nr:maleylpyruvate isomerase family mycothiol-dependent enzyme [Streptomyces polyasparticus]MBC9719105.1 maleylpyruvate isomerase family mycothiol-dependent enzyme [Streptomyces polyasparticus]
MPPKPRPRTYDPAKTRKAVLAQFETVREAVRALDEEQLARPTHLEPWTVRELAAHIGMAMQAIVRALEAEEPRRAELSLDRYPSVGAPYAQSVAEAAQALAVEHKDLDAWYGELAARITELLDAAPAGRLVQLRIGAMALDDFMVTRTVELVVHTDDLNRAAGLGIPLQRQALATCTRYLADVLATTAPGASTEVRIPPYAVVQCIEGPRHTRGTPPNVVETDPLTWVRLATGRTAWADALGDAKVAASGERADLSALLPLMQ